MHNMERRDLIISVLAGVLSVYCGIKFQWNYADIAENGLTLSSIVLAVYVAAITGLINSDLAKKMQKSIAARQKDKTQLGVLTQYFKIATSYSIATIFVSSLILLVKAPKSTEVVLFYAWSILSLCGLVFYVENLVLLAMVIRFMLNRQIWNN